MIRFACMVLSIGVVLGLASTIAAEDKKAESKTLEGTITCAKCDLGIAKDCATVIKVKEGGKDVIYWFDKDGDKKNHGKICKEAKEGKVTGTLGKDGDKLTIKVTKVEFK
jgi:hypothetical protein